jgi:hypothetical protein
MRFERPVGCDPPIFTAMEGLMKMMTWSRYHCLSWSLLRAGRQRRTARIRKIRHRHHGIIGVHAFWRLWPSVSRRIVSNS